MGRAKTVNGAHQYTSRTVPAAVDVLGLANPTASVLVNGVAATRKGEYFYRSVPAPNSSGPWFTTNSVQSLYGGASPETGTLFVPQTPEVFTPDPDGNLVRDGRWDYTWDGENRLVRMESLTNAPVPSRLRVEFGYDYQGRRIWKRVTSLSTGSVLPERKFVDEGWNLVAELTADLRLFKSFSWGLDLSGSLQGAGGVGGLLWVSHFLSGQVTSTDFATYDGNGNVAALVSASSGALSARYEYGPFGEVLRATGPMAKVNSFRFSTKYQDEETDLLYYGYRYYNASTGKWLSRDPAQEAGGLGLYSFVSNAPLMRTDPLGLCDSSGGYGLSCPCLVKVRLGNESYDALRDMLKAHINWVTSGGRPSALGTEERILDELILLGKRGGPLGFALLARTACGPSLNIWAISLDNKDFRAAWNTRDNQLQVNGFYKWYNFLSTPQKEFMQDDLVSDWGVAGAIALGHELGHAYIGLDDPFNYRVVENSIRMALGVPLRYTYDDVYSDYPYIWDGLGAGLGVPRRVDILEWDAERDRAAIATFAFMQAWSCSVE